MRGLPPPGISGGGKREITSPSAALRGVGAGDYPPPAVLREVGAGDYPPPAALRGVGAGDYTPADRLARGECGTPPVGYLALRAARGNSR